MNRKIEGVCTSIVGTVTSLKPCVYFSSHVVVDIFECMLCSALRPNLIEVLVQICQQNMDKLHHDFLYCLAL